jgi:hypothetical protein
MIQTGIYPDFIVVIDGTSDPRYREVWATARADTFSAAN